MPALIAAITLAGRRWGPAVAGWLSAFPVVAGPILFFIAVQQGAPFAAEAAVGTLSAVLAILVFGIGYAWGATRFAWLPSLGVGFAGYAAAVVLLKLWSPPLLVAAPAALAALLVAPRLYPVLPPAPHAPVSHGNDILWRMGAGAVLVVLVTHFSAALGPRLSGVLAMFPVMGSVLTVFSHRQAGAAFAVRLLRGMVMGYYAFGVFCIALSLALPVAGLGLAFGGALAGAVLVQAVSRLSVARMA